ncbi:hypothetical protein [Candidatus Mancarchaeum acidiphilum]|nr:hypothetical protein [Candidatus Mancarchaeum acidiphilum]
MVSKTRNSYRNTLDITSFNDHDSKLLKDIYRISNSTSMLRLEDVEIKALIEVKGKNSIGLVTNLNYKESGRPITIFINNFNWQSNNLNEIERRIKTSHSCTISINARIYPRYKSNDFFYPFSLYIDSAEAQIKL